jgi:hypothetical protein
VEGTSPEFVSLAEKLEPLLQTEDGSYRIKVITCVHSKFDSSKSYPLKASRPSKNISILFSNKVNLQQIASAFVESKKPKKSEMRLPLFDIEMPLDARCIAIFYFKVTYSIALDEARTCFGPFTLLLHAIWRFQGFFRLTISGQTKPK